MPSQLLDEYRCEIQQLCEDHHVRRLEAFGSVTRADFDETHSDIDLLIDIASHANSDYADNYFAVKEGLESLFNRPVDLLSTRALSNPWFIESIADERVILVGS